MRNLTITILCLGYLLAHQTAVAEPSYPHANEPIGTVRQVYDGKLDPQIQINTFRNIDRLFPTRVVAAGSDVRALPAKARPFTYFDYLEGDDRLDLYDYLSQARVAGLLVLHGGEIAYERYLMGNSPDTRWMSMSVVKSMCAALVGAAIEDGFIGDLDDALTVYLPRFDGSAYDGVSIRQLLQMTSGVAWNETYTDPASDRRAMLDAQISEKPGAILELMAALPRAAPPGSRWNYSTGETHVVGALLRAAVGEPVADYLSRKIWKPAGMQANATWWLEAPDGLEVCGSGLSATLRDYARFGLFLAENGVARGKRVLPAGWMAEASTSKRVQGELVDYGYMLWPLANEAYAAIGIFGQWVYVHPQHDVVIAMWSAHSKPVGRSGLDEEVFLDALSNAVDRFYD
ncbi:MAG: serine hydrolase [Congregibacter sp.]